MRDLLSDHDAAMAAAGAADPDRQVRLALAPVRREQQREQAVELVEELGGVGLAEHVVAHLGVGPGERAQLLDPVRVREEAAVEHEVDVERQAVLVAERHDRRLQEVVDRALREELPEPVAQLVDVGVAGVDDEVGVALQPLEQRRVRG